MNTHQSLSLEQERIAALDRFDILDTRPEEAFDRITRLTRRLFDVPLSTITFFDGHRQWLKSRQEPLALETERGPALCNVVVQEAQPLVIQDARSHPLFRDNPFVTGSPYIRFYAGVPLQTNEGAESRSPS